MRDSASKKIIEEIAEERGLSVDVVKEIIRSMYLEIERTIRNSNLDNYANILLPKFGKFYGRPGKIKFYKELNKKREEQSNES